MKHRAAVAALLLLAARLDARGSGLPPSPPDHEFNTVRGFLTMKDGVRLATTTFRPVAKDPSETFPVLFEFLPYRKDDSFYQRDYPLYSYFN